MILGSMLIVATSHGSIKLRSNVNETTPGSSDLASVSSSQLFFPLKTKHMSMSTLLLLLRLFFVYSGGLCDFSDLPVIVKVIVCVPNFSMSFEVNANFPVCATNIDLVVPLA